MKKIIALYLISLSVTSFAKSLNTRVVEVMPTSNGLETMVFIEAQERVIWLKSTDSKNIAALNEAKNNGLEVRINFEEKTGNLIGAQLLETSLAEIQSTPNDLTPTTNYTPTIVKDLEEANRLFSTMDKETKRKSQCYNRAYGWSYDLWEKHRIDSKKIFIFFTRRFIETYRYHWWFHVSPMVDVQTEAGVEEFVLDRTYSKGPKKVQDWTNYFVKQTKPVCPRVDKYSDYRKNQNAHDCYVIVTSQYYRQPYEIERVEKQGIQETEWDHNLLRASRKDAFKKWRAKYYR